MEAQARQILAEQLSKNDRNLVNSNREIVGSIETYVLRVLPDDLLATLRAVATDEINVQILLGNNPSQIIVDNVSAGKRSIERATRRIVARFVDTTLLIKAVSEIFGHLQRITRLQNPAKNAIIARREFFLTLNGINLGRMPEALVKIGYEGVLTQDSIVRVVGPLVPYGRKLFWNPVGASSKMNFYRVKSKRSGVRFLPLRGSSAHSPRFRPYAARTLRRKANATASPVETLKAMLAGDTPPGRIENVGQIVKRLMKRAPIYRGLHFTDGWVEHVPAIGWSQLRDPRVPAFGVMFAKKGAMPI
jgi:hypothetical protein